MSRSLAFAVLALGWISGAEALAQPTGGARIPVLVARAAPDAPPHLAAADLALAHRQRNAATEAMERAQTAFLNARLRGEQGLGRAIGQMGMARAALERGDYDAARAAIRPMLAGPRAA
jgi:ATP/maltotriose-dependent transcriptional regulator MalT